MPYVIANSYTVNTQVYKLAFRRIFSRDYSDLTDVRLRYTSYNLNASGTPPYYICSKYVSAEGTKIMEYISSSNVLSQQMVDSDNLDPHTIFWYPQSVVKIAALRTVLQAAAIQFPERFATPSTSTPDWKDVMGVVNSALRIISMMSK